MVEIAAAVETHTLDALFLRPRGDPLPHQLARLDLALRGASLRHDLLVERGDGHDRAAAEIVHQLRVDVIEAPVHGEARPLGRPHHLLPDSHVPPGAALEPRCRSGFHGLSYPRRSWSAPRRAARGRSLGRGLAAGGLARLAAHVLTGVTDSLALVRLG